MIITIMNTTTSEILKNDVAQVEILMPSAGYIAAALTLSLIGFFGFFLNLFVIILMWKDRKLWTPINIILFNLVFSDFLVSIFGNPWSLTSAIYKGWVFGRTMCVVYGFFMATLGISSITTLTVLAFERYMIVSRVLYMKCVSKRNAVYMVLGIWIYTLVITTPPLFGWGKYVNEAANISCSVNWEDKSTNTKTYILYMFAFGLVIPIAVISFSYLHIIRIMQKKKMKVGKVSRVEGRVAYMVLVMISAFLFAWTPYATFALIAQFAESSVVSPAMGVLPALLAKSSICYNPIIYVGLNSQFRNSVKQFFGIQNDQYDSTAGPTQYLSQSVAVVKVENVQTNGEQHIILLENLKPNNKCDNVISSEGTDYL